MRKIEKIEDEFDADLVMLAREVLTELDAAIETFPPMNSEHEGKAIIEEEFDELWDEIKVKDIDRAAMRKEAIQVAAMAMRFVYDVCDKK